MIDFQECKDIFYKFLMVAFTASVAFGTWRLTHSINQNYQALKLQERQIKATTRPYILLKNAKLVSHEEWKRKLGINFTLKNVGNKPAVSIRISLEGEVIKFLKKEIKP